MGNVWTQFANLLPKQKQFIGKIKSIDEVNTTCSLELLSGDNIIVKGTGDIDSLYLVKDGVIVSKMPSLTVYNETIN